MRILRTMRTVFLGIVSLAVAGGLFVLYQYSQTQSLPVVEALKSTKPEPSPDQLEPPSKGDAGSSLLIGKEQVPVTGGERVDLHLYEESGRQRAQIIVDEWRPVGDDSNEFEVESPVIRLRTPNGQLVKVSADHGRVILKSADPRSPDPKNGRLMGNVRITVDRLSEEQRAAMSPEELAATEDQRLVRLFLEDLFFDVEYAQVKSEGPFRVESPEVTVEGTGLSVRYNELESRIEELIIAQGDRIEVRGMNEEFALGLSEETEVAPAGADGGTEADPAETSLEEEPGTPVVTEHRQESDVEIAAATAELDQDLPVVVPDEPDPSRVHPTDVYTAVFEGDVAVSRHTRDDEVGRLVADRLEILFDFGQRERDVAKRTMPPTGETADQAESDTSSTEDADQPDQQGRILLTWNGKLRLTSTRTELVAEDAAGKRQRVHITATGNEVRVNDPERDVLCQKLIYHNETQRVHLFGSVEQPVHIASGDLGELWGTEILLQPAAQSAYVKGPGGRLLSTRGGAFAAGSDDDSTFDARFEDELYATFGMAEFQRIDPDTGETVQVARRVIKHATFSGNVEMIGGMEQIRCRRIAIDFAVTDEGRLYPAHAEAYEDVSFAQGSRFISADDRILVDIEMVAQDRPPFDLARARYIARARGKDPDTLDWDAIRADYESKKDYEPGLRRLVAYRNVKVRDPGQDLNIDCDTLDCRFAQGRLIQSGEVVPEPGKQASVQLGKFSISAPTRIPFDAVAENAGVDGPGRMTFPVTQDIDGRDLDEPLLATITWSNRMAFQGDQNQALFDGEVHIETKDSKYDCGTLRIDFIDTPPPDPAAVETRTIDWWLFTPLVDRVTGESAAERDSLRLAGPSFNKDPVYLHAAGGVTALTSNVEPGTGRLKSRALIKGPIMAVDMRENYVLVDGAGNLLIEDYQKPAGRKPSPQASRDQSQLSPFGGSIGNEPSQTYMEWKKHMSYRYELNVAEFQGDVLLVHRTGSKMKYAGQLLGSANQPASEGREAVLTCDSLVASFLRSERDQRAGAGRLSGTEVQAFNASGRVHFEDSGISAIAHQITYDRGDNVLQVLGTEDSPAQLFDQREGFREFTGPKITWDRDTNRIDAPKSSGRVN